MTEGLPRTQLLTEPKVSVKAIINQNTVSIIAENLIAGDANSVH